MTGTVDYTDARVENIFDKDRHLNSVRRPETLTANVSESSTGSEIVARRDMVSDDGVSSHQPLVESMRSTYQTTPLDKPSSKIFPCAELDQASAAPRWRSSPWRWSVLRGMVRTRQWVGALSRICSAAES